jgi:hypothetical protein
MKLVFQGVTRNTVPFGIWAIYLSTVLRATFDERDYIIRG